MASLPDDDLPDNPPEGFQLSTTRGPFTTHNGPYFHKVTDEGFWHGIRARHRHCNSHGIVHGGMLMAFADGLCATAVSRATRSRLVTIRLTTDFVDMARAGEWIEGTAEVTRATRSVAFVEGKAYVGDRLVFTASGIFKLFRRDGRAEDRKKID